MKADREIKVRCSACGHLTRIPTITYADRIRAMTDEELADFINGIEAEAIKRSGRFLTENDIERGRVQRLYWLKQECES